MEKEDSLKVEDSLVFLKNLLVQFTMLFLPIYFLQLGFNGWQTGVLLSLFTISALLVSFPIGIASDRLGSKHLIMMGLLLLAVFSFGIGYLQNFWLFVILFLVGGFGNMLVQISVLSVTFRVVKNFHRGTRFGIFNSFSHMGSAVGIFIGGFLLMKSGFSPVLKFAGGMFVILIIFAFFIPKTRKSKFALKFYELDFFQKPVIIFIILMFLYSLHWGAEKTSFALFLQTVIGLDKVQIGIYIAAAIVFLVLFSYFFGKKLDHRFGDMKLLYIGLILSGVGHIFMTYPNLYFSFFFRVVHEIGDAGVLLISFMAVSKLFSLKRIGGDGGALRAIMIFGSFAGALIYGPVGYKFGYQWPILISGIIILITCLLVFVFRKQLKV
ncbi:MFS transporter [Candidatus Woesearchaeota archaeon]|nr:MFS transporter [Candidatus Woesearchaeota archaeon]MBW3018101.1 MFS transporter [Candidatus Woesearchaeota archaeon]